MRDIRHPLGAYAFSMGREGNLAGLLEHVSTPYDLVASDIALRASEIREAPEGADYDYKGLAEALESLLGTSA